MGRPAACRPAVCGPGRMKERVSGDDTAPLLPLYHCTAYCASRLQSIQAVNHPARAGMCTTAWPWCCSACGKHNPPRRESDGPTDVKIDNPIDIDSENLSCKCTRQDWPQGPGATRRALWGRKKCNIVRVPAPAWGYTRRSGLTALSNSAIHVEQAGASVLHFFCCRSCFSLAPMRSPLTFLSAMPPLHPADPPTRTLTIFDYTLRGQAYSSLQGRSSACCLQCTPSLAVSIKNVPATPSSIIHVVMSMAMPPAMAHNGIETQAASPPLQDRG